MEVTLDEFFDGHPAEIGRSSTGACRPSSTGARPRESMRPTGNCTAFLVVFALREGGENLPKHSWSGRGVCEGVTVNFALARVIGMPRPCPALCARPRYRRSRWMAAITRRAAQLGGLRVVRKSLQALVRDFASNTGSRHSATQSAHEDRRRLRSPQRVAVGTQERVSTVFPAVNDAARAAITADDFREPRRNERPDPVENPVATPSLDRAGVSACRIQA